MSNKASLDPETRLPTESQGSPRQLFAELRLWELASAIVERNPTGPPETLDDSRRVRRAT